MSAFDPSYAVHVQTHGGRTLNTAVIGVLEEASLLVHSVACRGSRQKLREFDHEENLILRADYDAVLTWSVTATVLDFSGLADYHPGAPLSRQGLLFANGGRTPYQFRREASGDEVGVLYFEDPSTSHDGGDTPEISFGVTLEFSDLDTDRFPGEETTGEGWTVTVPGFTPDPAAAVYPLSVYWEDTLGHSGRFLRITVETPPDLAALYASTFPPSASYDCTVAPSSTPTPGPNYEAYPDLSSATDITITGVWDHVSGTWLLGSGTGPGGIEVLIPFWYDDPVIASATAILTSGEYIGQAADLTEPGTGNARAALWSSVYGWLETPAPGGPAWTAPADPLAEITGLSF